jgi:hypothetical protein
MQQIPPENLVDGDTYYIERVGPDGSLTKHRGTAKRITSPCTESFCGIQFDNVIAYVNGKQIPSPSFYAHNARDTEYHSQFYKPVTEDLMTKQVIRQWLGMDEATSWGLHKQHINPDISRGGKRTRTQRIKKSKSKKSKKLRKTCSKRQRTAKKTRSKRNKI